MSEACVVGVYGTIPVAEDAVHILDRAGLPPEQVSLVSTDLSDRPDLVEDLKLRDDSIRDAAIGAGLGGVVGLLAGLGSAVAAGLGLEFIVAAQAAVSSAVTGAFVGSLTGCGVHHRYIWHYEKTVREGHPLIVAFGDPLELAHAHRILKETGAEENQQR